MALLTWPSDMIAYAPFEGRAIDTVGEDPAGTAVVKDVGVREMRSSRAQQAPSLPGTDSCASSACWPASVTTGQVGVVGDIESFSGTELGLTDVLTSQPSSQRQDRRSQVATPFW
jgi:hypothetical protein